jgi:hypothetical protein
VFDEAKTKNDLITYKSVLQKYPDIEYAKDINELILKFEKVLKDSTVVKSDMNKVITLNTPNGDKLVAINVSGNGKTQDEAKQVALRSAIEQAFGTFISSKTEILNDQVVSDQIASVANGNIQSFTILNESQLPDSTWVVTLKAIVSVDKLTSFVAAKGIAIEIKGDMFAMNIEQQLLNEQGEIKAVKDMIGLLYESMQISFDYTIKSSDPKSLDAESKNWEIPLEVTATANKNIDFCANYCIKTLGTISLSSEEVTSYEKLNKAVFTVVTNYKGLAYTFYLRKVESINALYSLASRWEFFTRLFTVQNGIDTLNGAGEGKIYNFSSGNFCGAIKINFLTTGKLAAIFSWKDQKELSQIKQMTEYKVKPRGVVSQLITPFVLRHAEKEAQFPLRHVAKEAQFPGGMNKFIDFLNKNLQYPDAERERGEEGTSSVEFVVDANGNISDVKVISSAGASFDTEAMRIVRMMPKWNPGMQGGQPVPSYYTLPISFILEGE